MISGQAFSRPLKGNSQMRACCSVGVRIHVGQCQGEFRTERQSPHRRFLGNEPSPRRQDTSQVPREASEGAHGTPSAWACLYAGLFRIVTRLQVLLYRIMIS